jgi:hypothetical protein
VEEVLLIVAQSEKMKKGEDVEHAKEQNPL